MKLFIVLTALLALPYSAIAEQRPTPNPADSSAKVPTVKYESAFVGYAPYREEQLAPWRGVNDAVGRTKGHAGIFGGAGQGGHGAGGQAVPAKPSSGQPAAAPSKESAGQPPARSEPAAAGGPHKGH